MIEFQFASLAELWSMKGHGPYVWACYGLMAAALIYLTDKPRRRHHNYLKQQQRIKVANEQIRAANTDIEN